MFKEEYKDYIIIFIIRNPLFVFSSLNKRFNYKIPNNHSFNEYVNTLTKFIKYKNIQKKNLYTIKYEDLFKNNYKELKKILNDIGFQYDNTIFDNSKYNNYICNSKTKKKDKIPYKKPKDINHGTYRSWQINQPFIFNNDISKINLKKKQYEEIINNPYVLKLYPNINSSSI